MLPFFHEHALGEDDSGKVVYQAATDVNTTGLFNRSPTKGLISTLPEVPGLMVYKQGHVGVYVCNGKVIEAKGFASGIVESDIKATAWTHWIAVPWISYAGYEDKLRPSFEGPYTALVITQSTPLNIRALPSPAASSLKQVKRGDTLTVLGHADVIGWAKVQKDGVVGFSDAQYLQRVGDASPGDVEDNKEDQEQGIVAPPSASDGEPLYQAVVVNVKEGLNLRISPNLTAGNTIVLMPLGAMVDVYADNIGDGFSLVRYGKLLGYCTRSYLMQVAGEAQTLYNVRADGVTQGVVELIRSVYPGAVVTEIGGNQK